MVDQSTEVASIRPSGERVTALTPKPPSAWARAARSLVKRRYPLIGLLILLGVIFLAVFGPNIAPKDPNRQDLFARLVAPMTPDRTGVIKNPLGTDSLGRDVLSRLIYGARVSLMVGITAVAIGGTVGTFLGMLAGYFGGKVDDLIMRLADVQLAFPFILLAIMVLVILGQGVVNLVIILGVGQWVVYARVARGQVISQREKEYVEAMRAIGARDWRIITQEIFPNIIAPLIVIASFNVAGVILSEASLSFLGLGVPPSVPTWGSMLADSRDQLLSGKWWLAVLPGVAIMLTTLSLNVLGDWVRDFLDPRLRGSEGA
ncbi:MAG: ABC transporter permease [Chloroflexi bacterium]|nr:ABC transporter permease [Chloroflexota bacterium]MCC6893163.1 ABC transporter permease [Anaerolineae bacterium]